MEALAQSLDLPESRLRASHWHLQLMKTSLGLFSGHFESLFCVFLGLPWLPGAGKRKLSPGASICQSLGSGGAAGAEI